MPSVSLAARGLWNREWGRCQAAVAPWTRRATLFSPHLTPADLNAGVHRYLWRCTGLVAVAKGCYVSKKSLMLSNTMLSSRLYIRLLDHR